jgi:hypothetical protein
MNRLLPRAALWLLALAGLTGCPSLIAAPLARDLLRDPSSAVRLRAALALAESNDAGAVPVLIDLLAELPSEQRRPVEEFLTKLAGEWAPVVPFRGEDDISRHIRRDAWAAWWRNTDGPALLALIGKHTLTAEKRAHLAGLIAKYTACTEAQQRDHGTLDSAYLVWPCDPQHRVRGRPRVADRVGQGYAGAWLHSELLGAGES